jgi:hypothetical protein
VRILSAWLILAFAVSAVACFRDHVGSPIHPRAAATAETTPRTFPGGVADASERFGYLRNAAGVLEAVDLDSGHTIWTSERGSDPLVVATNLGATVLVALALDKQASMGSRVAILDAATGAFIRISEPIVLPDWATGAGGTFSIRAIDGGDPVVLEWHATSSWGRGVAPPPNYRGNDEIGRVELAVSTGAIRVVDRGASDDRTSLPVAVRGMKSAPVFANGAWTDAPLVAGSRVAVAVRVFEPLLPDPTGAAGPVAYERWSLRRWDRTTGEELPTVPLLRGRGVIANLSTDGHELVLLQGLPRSSLSPDEYVHSVFSIETGALVAKIPRMENSGVNLGVAGTHAFVIVAGSSPGAKLGQSVAAFDIKTGRLLWTHALFTPVFIPPPP